MSIASSVGTARPDAAKALDPTMAAQSAGSWQTRVTLKTPQLTQALLSFWQQRPLWPNASITS